MWKKLRNLLPSSKAKTAKVDESPFALKRISELREGSNVVDVVFVHGLGGEATETWTGGEFWPNWLEEDVSSLQVWSLQWPAHKFSWLRGDGMAVQDRTVAVLELLQAHGVGNRPLIFCCHSLGGVLVKAMLREASTMNKPDWQKVVASTKGVVFLATPHTGADLARIGGALGGSVVVKQLEKNDPHLREVNRWFRQNASGLGLAVKAFIETKPFWGQIIVDESSGDPCVEGCIAIGIDADHFKICKPDSRHDLVYSSTLAFINGIVRRRQELVRLPTRVVSFFESYLKSETTPVPFGGRKDEFTFLDGWLSDATRPHRLLIAGAAGRGKSALLVRWIDSIRTEDPDWNIVFVPISMRFATNMPGTFYKLWLDQVLSVTDQPAIQLPPFDQENFLATTLIEKIKSLTTKTIIVVDGLDESLDQRFDEALFTFSLPSNVRLIVAARLQAGDTDGTGWLNRLGWTSSINAEKYELGALSLEDTRDVVFSWAPGSLPEEAVVSELFRLTEGEPLLLSLYLEEMGTLILQGSVDADALAQLAPGFNAYFQKWMDLQLRALREAEIPYEKQVVDMVLAILGCAQGPLAENDLISIFERAGGAKPFASNHLVSPISRFVMGDGSSENGYVLNHPKFGQYVREDYLSKSGVEAAEDAFLSWCSDCLLRVEEKKLSPDQIPPYVLQFYVTHLEKSNRSWREYSTLICRGFKDAWENFEGGNNGFSSSVRAVLERLERADRSDDTEGILLAQISASSCLASISSIGRNLSAGMLSLALREKVWTPLQVRQFIDLHHPENRAGLFSATISFFEGEDLEQALNELVAPIWEPNKAGNRAQYLVRALGSAPALSSRLLPACREAVANLSDPYRRSMLQVELAEYDSEMGLSLLQQALDSVPLCEKNQVVLYGRLHHAFAQVGEKVKAKSTLRSALRIVDDEVKEGRKVNILLSLYDVLPKEEVVSRLKPHIEYCRSVFEATLMPQQDSKDSHFDSHQAEHLCARYAKVCIVCGEWGEESIIEQLTSIVKRIGRDYAEVNVLIEALPFCSELIREELARICLEKAKALPTGNNRSHAFMKIGNVASSVAAEAARECVRSAQLIEDQNSLIHCCLSLFEHLSPQAKLDALPNMMKLINSVFYVLNRGEFLILLAKNLPSNIVFWLFQTGVNLMGLSWDYKFRNNRMVLCLKHLPESLKQRVFDEVAKYEAEHDFDGAFHYGWVASEAPELWSKELLDRCLLMANDYSPDMKELLLAKLAPILVRFGYNEKLEEILTDAMEIKDSKEMGINLSYLLPYFDEGRREEIADYYGKEIKNADPHKGLQVARLIKYMSPKMREQAVSYWTDVAMSDSDVTNWRLLCNLLPHLEGKKRDIAIENLFSWALTLPVDKLAEVASLLLPLLPMKRKLSVLGKLFNGSLGPRSTYFNAVGVSAPVFQDVGGDKLINEVMVAMETVADWWP